MLKVNSPIARETLAVDPETQKPIVIKLDPPGLMIGLRTKQSKQTYTISILDVYMAAKQAKGEDFKAIMHKPSKPVPQEPDIPDVIKDVLAAHDRLHFSQVREQLRKKGIDVSKKVTGSLLKLMTQTHQVQHDERMYYFLTNKAS
jgi:hypothetical protein